MDVEVDEPMVGEAAAAAAATAVSSAGSSDLWPDQAGLLASLFGL